MIKFKLCFNRCLFNHNFHNLLEITECCASNVNLCPFFSIRALKGAKGEDVEISAPPGICVTTDDGRTLGNITQTQTSLKSTLLQRMLSALGYIEGWVRVSVHIEFCSFFFWVPASFTDWCQWGESECHAMQLPREKVLQPASLFRSPLFFCVATLSTLTWKFLRLLFRQPIVWQLMVIQFQDIVAIETKPIMQKKPPKKTEEHVLD